MKISKEIKIALSAIIAAIIIYVGIIFLKGVSFSKSSNRYYVEMNDVNGLAEAAPVLANGVQIGIVNSVRFVTEKQNVLLEIELIEGVRIPNGSKATLAKEMLGAAKLKIILGSKASGYMAINDTIFGTTGGDLLSAAGDMVPDIEDIRARYPIVAWNCTIKPGDRLSKVTNGASIMGRGFFVIKAGSKEELDVIAKEILGEFETEEV